MFDLNTFKKDLDEKGKTGNDLIKNFAYNAHMSISSAIPQEVGQGYGYLSGRYFEKTYMWQEHPAADTYAKHLSHSIVAKSTRGAFTKIHSVKICGNQVHPESVNTPEKIYDLVVKWGSAPSGTNQSDQPWSSLQWALGI